MKSTSGSFTPTSSILLNHHVSGRKKKKKHFWSLKNNTLAIVLTIWLFNIAMENHHAINR